MNKKEEKKLINLIQKEVKKNEKIFGHPIITVSVAEKIINFVTEHDKRERERFIDKIIEDIYSYDGNLISRTAIEIINKYK